jgi:hypothetical protein
MNSKAIRHLLAAQVLCLAGCVSQQPGYDLSKLRMKAVEKPRVRKKSQSRPAVYHYYLDDTGREIKHGPWMEFQRRETHRVPYSEGYYRHGKLHGHVIRYGGTNQAPSSVTAYRHGEKHGLSEVFHSCDRSRMASRTRYHRGKRHGERVVWDTNGVEICRGTYRHGEPLDGTFDLLVNTGKGTPPYWSSRGVIGCAHGLPLAPDWALPATETMRRLAETTIPESDCRASNIYDVLAFFAEALSVDTDGARGVPVMVTPLSDYVPLITFHARNVNATEMLRIITSVAGLRARLTENGVLVVSPGLSRPGDVTYKPPATSFIEMEDPPQADDGIEGDPFDPFSDELPAR